jgi:Imelysin
MSTFRVPTLVVLLAAVAATVAACGGDDERSSAPPPAETKAAVRTLAGADLRPVKTYLLDHTDRLEAFATGFERAAARYQSLAEGAGYRYADLFETRGREVVDVLAEAKRLWIEGNPAYERMEGIVAGTPSLARYDVILDAGSSAAEDPASAVPFDLELADGRTLEQPGNLFSLTEGMLWGTRDDLVVRRVDLDGDGRPEFGEALPDAPALAAAAEAFSRYAAELGREARGWRPTPSDAFTSLVVMVPTMSEYFGQWKESRFVAGNTSSSDAFNVVSRLSDIRDILGSLEVVYGGVAPAIAREDAEQSAQTERELAQLGAFIERLYAQERAGKRFTAEQADQLGADAQARGAAIAGQVSQAAARLGVEIEQ